MPAAEPHVGATVETGGETLPAGEQPHVDEPAPSGQPQDVSEPSTSPEHSNVEEAPRSQSPSQEEGAGSACPIGNSFDGNTLVATTNGPKPIDQIKLGDQVLAYQDVISSTGRRDYASDH